MSIVYLGLFQQVFEWVLARIIEPVYKFVSNLLTTVFTWVFQEILAPILMPILKEILYFAIDLWKTIYSVQLYNMFSGILKLIDYLETAFDVFIGIRDVTYTDPAGNKITGSLLEVLLQQDTISTVFWVLTLGALGLALILTIYGTAKSAFDLDFENRRPVSKVLAAMMKTFVQFFTVPFLVYFLVKLAGVILKSVTDILSFGTQTTLGRIVFVIASLDAAKDEAYNISTASSSITLGTTSADIVRYPFYSMGGDGVAAKDYGSIGTVMDYFNLADFDYLIGFIAAAFLLFTIGVCLIVFVQRIFELILLYIVSPYFVCMMPLDDGEKFSRWREMFIGKCFTGFGSAIGMRLYLMICPMVMGNTIKFGSASSPEMDYMMKLFFLAGGAWAVYKSGPMITSLLSAQAGQSEQMTSALAGGFLFSQTAGRAIGFGRSKLTGALSGLGKKGAGREGAGAGGKDGAGGKEGGQKFQGTKAAVKPGKGWSPKAAVKTKAGAAGTKARTPNPNFMGKPKIGEGYERSKFTMGAHRKPVGAGTKAAGVGGAAEKKGLSGAFIGNPKIGEGAQRSKFTLGAHRAGAAGAAASAPQEETIHRRNFQLGSLFSNTYDDDGNRTFRVFGMGFTADSQGKTTSVSLPCLSLQRLGESEGGKMHVSRLRLPGVASYHANVEDGKLKFSDLNLKALGVRSDWSEDGSRNFSFFGGGLSFGKASDGSTSYIKSLGVQVSNDQSGIGVHVGNAIHVHSGMEGVKTEIGSGVSVQTSRGHGISGFKVGALSYSDAGTIKRQVEKKNPKGDKA